MGDLPQNERRNAIGRVYKPGTRLPDSQILWVVQLAKDNDVRAISKSQGITVPGVQNILSRYHACTCLEDVMAEHPKRGGARAASTKTRPMTLRRSFCGRSPIPRLRSQQGWGARGEPKRLYSAAERVDTHTPPLPASRCYQRNKTAVCLDTQASYLWRNTAGGK